MGRNFGFRDGDGIPKNAKFRHHLGNQGSVTTSRMQNVVTTSTIQNFVTNQKNVISLPPQKITKLDLKNQKIILKMTKIE